MVINGPTLLNIYVESVSQPASQLYKKKKKDLGVIKMRVIIFFFLPLYHFFVRF